METSRPKLPPVNKTKSYTFGEEVVRIPKNLLVRNNTNRVGGGYGGEGGRGGFETERENIFG